MEAPVAKLVNKLNYLTLDDQSTVQLTLDDQLTVQLTIPYLILRPHYTTTRKVGERSV